MVKTYFMRTYNLTISLLIYSIFIALLGGLFRLLNILLSLIDILDVTRIIYYINVVATILFKASITLVIIASLLFVIEIIKRMLKDSIFNIYKSIYYTISLRRFLTQNDNNDHTSSWNVNDNTTSNPIILNFNKAIKKCVVDVTRDKVTIVINIPHMQQAQKLLKMMEPDIKEEIASRHPNYYFSAPQRIKSRLWYEGKKRN